MINAEIARIFFNMADILEMKGVEWKPQAYRKAARAIENLADDVTKVYNDGGLKGLDEIPGVGEGIGKKIIEFIKSGKIKEYEKLKKALPKGFTEILDIPGMGPKKAKALIDSLHIKSIKDLEEAAKKHKVQTVKMFDQKSEDNILQSLGHLKKKSKRMPLDKVRPIAEGIVEQLRKMNGVLRVEVAGSIRRRKATVRDIDILVASKYPKAVIEAFTRMKSVLKVQAKGETRASVILNDNRIQADLRVVPKGSFGAAMQYFTGSKDHNIKLREIAIKKGFKLSEYGLYDKKTGKKVAGATEKGIYRKLRVKYVEPERREGMNELENK